MPEFEAADYTTKNFNPNFDPELVLPDWFVMPPTKDQFPVQAFLAARAGAIKDWKDADGRLASQIVESAADEFRINRKLLIVTLQREQSLIRMETLNQRALDRATGCAIYDPDPSAPPEVQKRRAELNAQHKGFANQVHGAAQAYAKHFKEWEAGKTIKVNFNREWRTPKNAATWALLCYCPHDLGSKITRDVWRGLFG